MNDAPDVRMKVKSFGQTSAANGNRYALFEGTCTGCDAPVGVAISLQPDPDTGFWQSITYDAIAGPSSPDGTDVAFIVHACPQSGDGPAPQGGL